MLLNMLLILSLAVYASATALTYKLVPNEKECFYTFVDKKDAKIAFYFAVQSGGSFDGELCQGKSNGMEGRVGGLCD